MVIKTYKKNDFVSEHFSYNELCCPCSSCGHALKVDTILLEKMETIRNAIGMPINVTSCYRCPKHNSCPSVRGAKNSAHIYSYATDWNCYGKANGLKVLDLVYNVFGCRFGIYQSRNKGRCFIHTDTSTVNKSMWISRLVNNVNCYTYYNNYDMLKRALLTDTKINWSTLAI